MAHLDDLSRNRSPVGKDTVRYILIDIYIIGFSFSWIDDRIIVTTTRPATTLGDTANPVHEVDDRYTAILTFVACS